MVKFSDIKYIEIYDRNLYKSYGYEIRHLDDFEWFLSFSRSNLKDVNDSDLMDDMILYLEYRLHSKHIMKYKEAMDQKHKELKTILDNYKETHEMDRAVMTAIHYNCMKTYTPEDVIGQLDEKIKFYNFVLELLERNRIKYNL